MYIIHFKRKIPSVEVGHSTGEAIKQMKEDKKPSNTLIDFPGGLQVELGDIGPVQPIAARRSEASAETFFLTEEQREEAHRNIARIGTELRAKGLVGANKDKPQVVWNKLCVECGKENPPGMARVCSSTCYVKNPLV